MNYCALDDAFQTISPGCADDFAARSARKERRKVRRCKDMKDPDRQPVTLPDVPPMGKEFRKEYEKEFNNIEGFRTDQKDETMLPKKENTMLAKKEKSYFGADPEDTPESFANYTPNVENYQLEPDFLKAFEHAGIGRAYDLPKPSTNMYWKQNPVRREYEISNEDIMKKLDRVWARLDDMNKSSPEQVTSELLMFISSGIFVIFMMDILVKKGSTMRF